MAYSTPSNDPNPRDRGPLSPDDALPPVEPPSAGFIVQLFVIPGIIVAIIVCVWLLFNPKAYVDAIKRNNEGRWQAAVNLANALNNERGADFEKLRNDRAAVKELAGILKSEIDDGSMQDKPVTFRIYLCKTLGSFEVADGLPMLITASTTRRDPAESGVQRAALQSIALLAENVKGKEDATQELTSALLTCSQDQDPLVRESAAFAMGVVGGDELLKRLRVMAEDAFPNARYNAATGLARHGDMAGKDTLLEMLDPEEEAGVKIEEEAGQEYKRALIEFNGLRAVKALIAENPSADRTEFIAAVKKLIAAEPPKNIALEAEELLRKLEAENTSDAGSKTP
jgi:hypothetical protein